MVETTSDQRTKTPDMLKNSSKLQSMHDVDKKHELEKGEDGSEEESCDLFSDNLSDTQSNRSLSIALNSFTVNKKLYHLFVFVHGF